MNTLTELTDYGEKKVYFVHLSPNGTVLDFIIGTYKKRHLPVVTWLIDERGQVVTMLEEFPRLLNLIEDMEMDEDYELINEDQFKYLLSNINQGVRYGYKEAGK